MTLYDLVNATEDDRAAALAAAVRALGEGRLVGIPTETVYGLAADATDGPAVAGIYAAKGRPSFNPLISHVADLAMAEIHGQFSVEARQLAAAFWPGPLTLVVPRRPGSDVCDLVTAGLDTLALRVPNNRPTLDLIRRFGRPIAAPSANRSGRISPTTAADVVADLGDRVAVVLDAGPCQVGLESTIVMFADGRPTLLRPGGVPREALEAVLGTPLADPVLTGSDHAQPLAPGMLTSHYAPRAAVRLEARDIAPGEAFLGFGGLVPEGLSGAVAFADLSPAGDLGEAAANLFRLLRQLDASGASAIAVAPVPGDGLGEAIRDRLTRAAAPRG